MCYVNQGQWPVSLRQSVLRHPTIKKKQHTISDIWVWSVTCQVTNQISAQGLWGGWDLALVVGQVAEVDRDTAELGDQKG